MKNSKLNFFALVLVLLSCASSRAGVSAVVIVYQPIVTASDAVTAETPKGFAVMAIPFLCHHFQGRAPYYAIAQPNQILTDAPRSILSPDSNLLSSAGVVIAGALDDGAVYVRFENLRHPAAAAESVTDDDVAEAALECVRRLAQDTKKRPKVIITGKKGDEAKWQKWQRHFEQQNLAKPFRRPNA